MQQNRHHHSGAQVCSAALKAAINICLTAVTSYSELEASDAGSLPAAACVCAAGLALCSAEPLELALSSS